MFLSLLQFFATKFLFPALHLESGSFPRPLSPQEEIKTFSAFREGDPSAREKLIRHNLRAERAGKAAAFQMKRKKQKLCGKKLQKR